MSETLSIASTISLANKHSTPIHSQWETIAKERRRHKKLSKYLFLIFKHIHHRQNCLRCSWRAKKNISASLKVLSHTNTLQWMKKERKNSQVADMTSIWLELDIFALEIISRSSWMRNEGEKMWKFFIGKAKEGCWPNIFFSSWKGLNFIKFNSMWRVLFWSEKDGFAFYWEIFERER